MHIYIYYCCKFTAHAFLSIPYVTFFFIQAVQSFRSAPLGGNLVAPRDPPAGETEKQIGKSLTMDAELAIIDSLTRDAISQTPAGNAENCTDLRQIRPFSPNKIIGCVLCFCRVFTLRRVQADKFG
jgi:hypothetical protein